MRKQRISNLSVEDFDNEVIAALQKAVKEELEAKDNFIEEQFHKHSDKFIQLKVEDFESVPKGYNLIFSPRGNTWGFVVKTNVIETLRDTNIVIWSDKVYKSIYRLTY